MTVPDEAAIIADWHGTEPCPRIARRHGCSESHVRHVWRRAAAEGLLPPGPRAAFVHHADRMPQTRPDDDPILDLRGGDNLLAALRRVHGRDPRRASDDCPIRDGARGAPLPTPAMLRAEAVRRDAECVASARGRWR